MIFNIYLFLQLLRYPPSSSSSSSFSSEKEGVDSEQERTKVKNQPVTQKWDLSQELSEDRQMFPSHPQLTGVLERSQTNNKLPGKEEGEPDKVQSLSWNWFNLPSKVIQVKPAAGPSKPRSQPVEPDKTSTDPPKKASAM